MATSTPPNWLELNRRAWDEGHAWLADKRRRNPRWAEPMAGGGTIFTELELALFGDVTGLAVLQTCCAGDASQALSLANMGAHVTACDFSEGAIEEATKNAAALGIDAAFVVDDAQTLATFDDESFDLVHIDGNLGCFEDLGAACRNWCRVLRPGGRLFLHENHPVTGCLEPDGSGTYRVAFTYGDRTPEHFQFGISDFVAEHDLPAIQFRHTLADIVNAVASAGLRIERMAECNEEGASFPMGDVVGLSHELFLISRRPR